MLDQPAIGMLSGAALLGAAGLRAGLAAHSGRRAKRRKADQRSHQQREFNTQLEAALQWAKASQPALKAWQGTRPFCVTAIVDEAFHCRSYYLEPTDGQPLPSFAPGQYLTFHLPTGDPQRPLVRCYTLSDRWRSDRYRVTIKHALPPANSPGIPAGLGSSYFHQHVAVGSTLECEAPQGCFFFDTSDSLPVVFIAGGIGMTPMMSMIVSLAQRQDMRDAWLFAGFRNGDERLFAGELLKLREQLPKLRVRTAYSRPSSADHARGNGTLAGYDHCGYIDLDYLQSELGTNNYRFYICGPPAMMQSLVPAIWAWGVPREHVHFEAFGPATISGIDTLDREPCDVKFTGTGETVRWTSDQETILAAAQHAGIDLPSGCRAGNCGQCRVKVLAGSVSHVKPPGVELGEGECLACIAVPEGDVVLE
ncbi:MAG: 2Fe-2S iron-sulfur cluster-binding protein [Lacipirellulaceae bacterium]